MGGLLASAWERWKVIARAIGNFQARLVLSGFYFLVVSPFALIVKAFKDPLGLRQHRRDSFWLDRKPLEARSGAWRQF